VLDLDDFKGLNDRYGHAAGDRALEQLGRVWAREFDGEGLLGREGGDEFVLVVPDADRAQVQRLLVQLHAASTVRWTAGLTQWQRGEDLEACLERADHDLYRRKRDPERRAA
jgi:diguanylate cyclase (GGDEF)-like protein